MSARDPAGTVLPPAAGDATPALAVAGLVKSYSGRRVLHGIDLEVRRGELVALLGANGSGKSTALRCVAGLTEPDSGTIRLDGADPALLRGARLARARSGAAMVFQQIHLVPRRTALDNVCSGALARLGPAALHPVFFPRALREEAMACLDRVGMADKALERAGRLSGGQQQRVAIARALCQRPTVLLADEPVSALDPSAAEQVMGLLADLAANRGLAVAAVLHQPGLALRHADRVVGLVNGGIAWSEPADRVGHDAVDALYAPEPIEEPA
ncbi:phosphonate transport system ATP-binding protein [Murinocardiopsis flavida]|uniref:Phosphonate transport system ATP-binding protein n=1 Tax=Murinocardiopsis flavida TaxID=645275 RepID=A0A2P8DI55_9ACTN|nr:phosphonate ABC transporter ATP-binding protein [Murinocardiopsis flavida]PSK96900.1 phosphonate transport system ATP-binding protein [Murinocardiopsis flavida]